MPRKKRLASVQPNEVIHTEGEERPFKPVTSLNEEQKELIKAIHHNDILFVNGLAGAGKTYIACGMGAYYLQNNLVDKLIVSRPQISAESSGWLPGSLEEKLSPYLMPVYTELGYFLNVKKEMNTGRLVVMPIAYCRGVTFKNSFVIIDEFENMDYRQLKMILTRFGENSKMIFCGDTTQTDLDNRSGKDCVRVMNAMRRLVTDPENKIAMIELKRSVRHPIIEKILQVLE